MITKFKTIILTLLTILFMSNTLLTTAYAAEDPPSVTAKGAILMDATTGEILYSKNIHTPLPPASTTKLMTALLVFENCELDEVVTISKEAEMADGSKIYIFEGEELTVEELLYALMLASGNDVAQALAEHIAGSMEAFADMMNERAKELGAQNTNFVNASGLYDDEHRTSAYDMALIMREVVKYPEFVEIALTPSTQIEETNKSDEKRPLWNGNRMVHQGYTSEYYEFVEAGKTGYTIDSEHSFVASAQKDDHRLIAALLYDDKKTYFTDTKALFEYGFDNFELVNLYSEGDIIAEYDDLSLVTNSDIFTIIEASDDLPTIDVDINYQAIDLNKNYLVGDYVVDASITYGDTTTEAPLFSATQFIVDTDAITEIDTRVATQPNTSEYKTGIATILIIIAIILILICIVRLIQIRKSKKRRSSDLSPFTSSSKKKNIFRK